MAPQAIHSNLSRPHPTDSRLLQNLIKGEKSYIDNLAASSVSGHAAASALAAWGTSEAPDISKAAQALAEILASVADAARTHVQALEGYRSALKDVLDREQSIRSVVRDRDVLVGRLIKASKKKISKKDSGLSQDEKMEKVNAAQRELHACEQVLASEEAALVGVKRRTFKEALTMRMKTMGDAGAATVEAAKEAILLLDEFDTHGPLLQATGGGQYESMYADDGVETGAYDHQALESGYYAGQQPASSIRQHLHHDHANGNNLTRDEQGRFHKDLQGKFFSTAPFHTVPDQRHAGAGSWQCKLCFFDDGFACKTWKALLLLELKVDASEQVQECKLPLESNDAMRQSQMFRVDPLTLSCNYLFPFPISSRFTPCPNSNSD